MKTTIEVKNRNEADALKRGLSDPTTRALVVVIGILLELPTKAMRQRVLNHVVSRLAEEESSVFDVLPAPVVT